MMDFDFNAVRENFKAECEEGLQKFEAALLALERTPEDQEQIQTVFRIVHTIKGNASAMEMPQLAQYAHQLENALGNLRDSSVRMTSSLCSALLKAVDGLRQAAASAMNGETTLPERCDEVLRELHAVLGSQHHVPPTEICKSSDGGPRNGAAESAGFLRVKVEKLDHMMDLAGEIAILQSRLEQSLRQLGESGQRPLEIQQELARLFLGLQEELLKARMVPILPLFHRFHRVVRDLAAASGKKATLVIESGDVEVDTAIAENLKDALMHMVRNAIDHGLESPEVRQRLGKDAHGAITLRARHESGSILIQVSDDGSGFHLQKILEKARQKGMILPQQKLAEADVLALVFEPGFSTTEQVTGISGRGVGMDVVRRNIDALHGVIHIESQEGLGSTIHLRLPLTLAIVDGITVCAAGENYVVPLENIVECLQLPRESLRDAEGGVFALRGEPLPYLRLRDVFGLQDAQPAERENVLIVNCGGTKAGVAVDELLGKGQTVIKPMGKLFKNISGIAGSTVLGNGCVALILDVPALVREATARRNRFQMLIETTNSLGEKNVSQP